MSLSRRSAPVALLLLALLAALPASAAVVAADGTSGAAVDTGAPPADAGCCCERDPKCGSPAEPCAPDGDCCAVCVASSLRVVPPSEDAEPDRTNADEPDLSGEDRTAGVGLGGGVWHPPRG